MNDSPSTSPSTNDSGSKAVGKKKRNIWRGFWLTFLVLSLAFAWYSFYVPSNDIAWAGNFTLAQQRAVETDKPIILYFTGVWCAPCRIMKRQVWADEEVTALVNERFIPVALDVDDPENAALMERYNIVGPPVIIVSDAEGNALRWKAGGMGKAEFLELLNPSTPD
ncbi:MAG: thioredoxin family protein [Phycisphaerales bacterium]